MIAIAGRQLVRLLPHRSDYAGLSRSWRRDALAGVTVGVVALPLALAFGISSGVVLPGDEQIALLRPDGAMFFGVAERISTMITDADHPQSPSS